MPQVRILRVTLLEFDVRNVIPQKAHSRGTKIKWEPSNNAFPRNFFWQRRSCSQCSARSQTHRSKDKLSPCYITSTERHMAEILTQVSSATPREISIAPWATEEVLP